jgi:hypothetical protein
MLPEPYAIYHSERPTQPLDVRDYSIIRFSFDLVPKNTSRVIAYIVVSKGILRL